MLYRCETCEEEVSATKTYRVVRCPKVLVVQLKRFATAVSKSGKLVRTYKVSKLAIKAILARKLHSIANTCAMLLCYSHS